MVAHVGLISFSSSLPSLPRLPRLSSTKHRPLISEYQVNCKQNSWLQFSFTLALLNQFELMGSLFKFCKHTHDLFDEMYGLFCAFWIGLLVLFIQDCSFAILFLSWLCSMKKIHVDYRFVWNCYWFVFPVDYRGWIVVADKQLEQETLRKHISVLWDIFNAIESFQFEVLKLFHWNDGGDAIIISHGWRLEVIVICGSFVD